MGQSSFSTTDDEANWYVRDVKGAQFGPVRKREIDDWLIEERIDYSYQIYQTSWSEWRPLESVYPKKDYMKTIASWVSGGIAAVSAIVHSLRAQSEIDWQPQSPHLRRCIQHSHHQYSTVRYCLVCNSETVGTDIETVLSGEDRRLQDCFAMWLPLGEAIRSSMVTAITITVSALSLAVLLMTMVLMCAGISWMVFAFAMFLSVTTLIVIGGAIIRSRNEIYSKRKAFEELQTLECPFKMSPQDKEHLCVDLLEPFILRNERPVGSHGFFAAKRLKAVNSAVDVMLDPAELSMLGIVASSKYGIGFLNDIGHATRVLTSYCLCCDFNLFKRHIEAAEPAYGTVFLAYAAITSNVSGEPLLPFLMHLLELRRVSIAPVDLSRRVDEARAQLEVIRFSKDLESRKSGSFNVTIEMVDSMNPYTFELLLGIIFESLGFCFTETPKSSDQGADVLLERAGERLVIQAKLYTDAVGNKAVQEAIAAREFHRCQFAMVVTNSRFTFSAGELATKAGVKLIGREELIQLLDIFNTRPKDYGRLRQLFQAN